MFISFPELCLLQEIQIRDPLTRFPRNIKTLPDLGKSAHPKFGESLCPSFGPSPPFSFFSLCGVEHSADIHSIRCALCLVPCSQLSEYCVPASSIPQTEHCLPRRQRAVLILNLESIYIYNPANRGNIPSHGLRKYWHTMATVGDSSPKGGFALVLQNPFLCGVASVSA